MSDPFNILDDADFATPQRWEEAVAEAVGKLQGSAARFEELVAVLPEDRFTDEEWHVVEQAAADVEEAVERAEEGYVAVQYDTNAWYRIMENLQRVHLRLDSAIGIMERVRERENPQG